MTADRHKEEGVREFRLEGMSLLLMGGLLIVLLGAAFYVGRWYERQIGPAVASGVGGDSSTLESVARVEPAADVDEQADYFDDVSGGQKQAEPGREIGPAGPPAAEEPAQAAQPAGQQPAPAAKADAGPHYVQVMAVRDRQSAEDLVNELTKKGFSVRLFTEREGRGALYKVRVGGYASRDEAREVADRLKRDGYAGAFVKTVE